MRLRNLLTLLIVLVVCSCAAVPLLAESGDPLPGGASVDGFDFMRDLGRPAVISIAFTTIGLVFFAICIWLIVKLTPFSVQKEIEEDQNTALGIIIGSMILGIAIILAASLLG